jgi:integrase
MTTTKWQRSRGNGEGSVFEQKRPTSTDPNATRWVAQVIVDGKPRRAIAKTEADAKRKLRGLMQAVDRGTPIPAGNLTVAGLLDDWATKALPNRNIEAATVKRHEFSINALKKDLGGKRIKDLRPEHVEQAFAKRAESGYSKGTLAKLRTTLRMALAWGERRGDVARNVASVVELPATARAAKPGKAMTADQARAFINAARGTPLEAMWLVCLYLGVRPGEAAGLAWDDVDYDDGVIHVRRSRKLDAAGKAVVGRTKTAQSVRSLDAPPVVLAALKAHRTAQNERRLAMGAQWSNPDDLVFTSPTGRPTDPARCRREFAEVVKAAKLGDGWTPNLLRHTAASLLSDAGLSIEELADQLGHKDTRMASLHYRHRVRPTVAGGTMMDSLLG